MSNPTRPELHTRRLVIWMSFVFAIALGAGALAANIPGLVVAILVLTGGAVGYFAYYKTAGWSRIVAFSLTGVLCIIAAVVAFERDDDSGIQGARIDGGSEHDVTTFASRAYTEALIPDQLSRFRSEDDIRGVAHMEYWGREGRGNTGTTRIRFTLVGQHRSTVYVTSIRIRVVERNPPPAGTLVYLKSEGAGANPQVGFDLDSGDVEARSMADSGLITSERYLDSSQIALELDEPVTILVRTTSATCYCKFIVLIGISDGTQLEVTDGGVPWSVSSFADSYNKSYLVSTKYNGAFFPCPWPSFDDFGPMAC